MRKLLWITFVKTHRLLVCPGVVPHFLIVLDCAVVHNLGLDFRITWGAFANPNTWPPPSILFVGISGKGPRNRYFLRFPESCQLYTSVNCCLNLISPWAGVECRAYRSFTASWGKTYIGQVVGFFGNAWLKVFIYFLCYLHCRAPPP